MRKFAKTLAVVSVLTPAGVNALGVGEIKLHSALNQKLLAEIPLLVSPGEDVSQIHVSLAPPNAFTKAGLTRPYYLSDLRFKPVKKADGSVVVQVTSKDVIREPFLDFLLEVDWPQGRMQREFTVLLDPPVKFSDMVSVAQVAPSAAKSEGKPETTPSISERSSGTTTLVTATSEEVVYGPVKRNESLWNIAKSLKTDPSVTTEQMAMAIFKANPGAFYHNNVNALKAGQSLKIPVPEEVRQLPPSEARQQFQKQYQAWVERSKLVSQTIPQAQANSDKDSQLKLEAPKDEEIQAAQAPVIEMPGSPNPQTLEMIESLREENEALRDRLESLEQRLTNLLEVKNNQLAQMQAQPAQEQAPEVVPDSTADSDQPGVTPSVTEAQSPQPVPVPPKVAPEPKPKQPEIKPVPSSDKEDTLLDGIFSEPLYLGIGSVSFMMLGLAGWMIWRRRQAAEEQADSLLSDSFLLDLDEDEDASAPQQTTAVAEVPEKSKEAAEASGVQVDESSFLSEFTPSDFDILETETDAVDPIAEADVYLAYGRYQQAEELIQQALEADSGRPELQLKLLEIYYAKEDSEAFEKYANKLYALGKQKDGLFWAKVVEMGRELCPQSSLFDLQSADDGFVDDSLENDSQQESATLDLDEFSDQADDPDPMVFDLGDEAGVDFSKGLGGDDESLEDEQLKTAEGSNDNTLEFDLGGINLDDSQMQDASASGQDLSAEVGSGDSSIKEEFSFEFEKMDIQALADKTDGDTAQEETFDLTDMDEMETKLDLARAYVDMEDVDSAKDILEDVFSHGNDHQREEAKALMEKLGIAS